MRHAQTQRLVTIIAGGMLVALCTSFSGFASSDTSAPKKNQFLMSNLGSINFSNSGSTAAQQAFLTGVKALHSFQFDEAGTAFKLAQEIDPSFALAYWGEAMSYNHPLWAQQNLDLALTALSRFAPTPEARAQKILAGRERDLMRAVDVLYGRGEKLARDIAYAETMRELHEAYPGDDEIATLYALSLLGTVRPGDTGVQRQMKAAAVALAVFGRNPRHPGAAHFIIHAFDDPEHAILALPAAQIYADIAPDAPHALHMPSHIFLQLGMWEKVVNSNAASYEAEISLAINKGLERGRTEFHSLSWLMYGHLQIGNLDEAKDIIKIAKQTVQDYPSVRTRNGFLSMLARYVVEAERWDEIASYELGSRDNNNSDIQYAIGLNAIQQGDILAAKRAAASIQSARKNASGRANGTYRAKIIAVIEKELLAAIAVDSGRTLEAERLLQEAVAIEKTLNAPSGPPQPMQPSFESYGAFLLNAGRLEEATEQFKLALQRSPNRAISMRGLKSARAAAAFNSTLH